MQISPDPHVSEDAVAEELDRVLNSPLFANSARLTRFMRYTVAKTLSGDRANLKEYIIGVEVYDRSVDYDPSQNPIVRVEASRLRSKLKQFYETDGKSNPVVIEYHTGSYAPIFRTREVIRESDKKPEARAIDEKHRAGVAFAVPPFVNPLGALHPTPFAWTLHQELTRELGRAMGCRVFSLHNEPDTVFQVGHAIAKARELGIDLLLEGVVREESDCIRFTVTLIVVNGSETWSQTYQVSPAANAFLSVEQAIVSTILNRISPQSSSTRNLRHTERPRTVSTYPDLLHAEGLLDEGEVRTVESALSLFLNLEPTMPHCARSAVGIVQCYYSLGSCGRRLAANDNVNAQKAAERAVSLDVGMISTQGALASAFVMAGDYINAEESFLQALRIGTHAATHRGYAELLTGLGRNREAYHHLRLAQAIDPYSCRQRIASLRWCYLSGEYAKAITYVTEMNALGTVPLEGMLYEALSYIALKELDKARAIAHDAKLTLTSAPSTQCFIAEVLARAGEEEAAREMIQDFRLMHENARVSWVRQGLLSLALNETEEAQNFFRKAEANKEVELCWLQADPRLDALRNRLS